MLGPLLAGPSGAGVDWGMRDALPETAAVHAAVLRRLTPEQRLLAALELSDATRALALARLRERFPEYTQRQLVAEWLRQTFPAH